MNVKISYSKQLQKLFSFWVSVLLGRSGSMLYILEASQWTLKEETDKIRIMLDSSVHLHIVSASNCGKILNGPSGSLQSTNFPNNYPNNEYCTWEIQVPQGKKVRLEFEELRTEENKDFVLIYDTGKTDPVVALNGVKDKPRAITSTGNSIRVRFISNSVNTNNGFKVSYKQTG